MSLRDEGRADPPRPASRPRCERHPSTHATVKVPRGEHPPRYLCGDCLRDERPILFVSLHLPATGRGIR